MLLNCSVEQQRDLASPSYRKSVLNIHWKDWCWNWNSNTLATWCEELTHFKRPWWWVRLQAGRLGDDRGWDGWMASLTQWRRVWVNSRSWWWTGKPGVLQSMGLQSRIWLSDWTELNFSVSSLYGTGMPGPHCCLHVDCRYPFMSQNWHSSLPLLWWSQAGCFPAWSHLPGHVGLLVEAYSVESKTSSSLLGFWDAHPGVCRDGYVSFLQAILRGGEGISI